MAHASLCRSCSGEPKFIPIVRMGVIGKTIVAKKVYNDVSIHSHYDVRAWATVSQQHNGKRYFPNQNNGSRILVTTRNNEMAFYADIENLSLHMDFMDQDKSWNLFKTAAFVNEALPYEFETIRKQIAEKCHGLPLTIVVVSGHHKSKRAIEDWESIANDVKSFVTSDHDKQCSHMAEGFVNLENDLEDEAEKCLQHLINRVLLTPSHYQLTDDNDKNHLLKRTHSVFFSGHFVSVFILKSEVIHFKFLKILDLSKCKSFTRNTQGVEVDPTWTS
ncbi:hypothetical protein KY285_020432 [Solanum tuberosum]|nr:hypothetical protein KY285_020432 [Solanum tuberosum]